MPCTAESCKEGLTQKCFAECPEWAKKAFWYRMLHLLIPAGITRRLPKGLGEALIAPGVEIPPGVIFPPGTTISPGTVVPPGWSPADPVPPGITIEPGASFPPGWSPTDPVPPGITIEPGASFPPGWSPGDPLPPGMLPPALSLTKLHKIIGKTGAMAPMTVGFGAGSVLSGGANRGGGGGAGCGCCYSAIDPIEFVGIDEETTNMELNDTQELTVENAGAWCEGHFYEWMITKGGGELSAGEGLSVIYTAPASGHGCPGETEITLYCCGEVMDTLNITINYDYSIEFNYPDPETEINKNDSVVISVIANNTPLTWEVSGTGFSLEHAETDGCGNVLHADETACGSAKITVKGCDDEEAIGYVRCTTGQWSSATNGCMLSGVADTKTVNEWRDIVLEKTQGKYYQYQTIQHSHSGVCNAMNCGDYGNVAGCLDWSCSDLIYSGQAMLSCQPFCCVPAQAEPPDCSAGSGWCYENIWLWWKEWIC